MANLTRFRDLTPIHEREVPERFQSLKVITQNGESCDIHRAWRVSAGWATDRSGHIWDSCEDAIAFLRGA